MIQAGAARLPAARLPTWSGASPPLADVLAADFCVARRRAPEVNDRRYPAQHLFNRRVQQLRLLQETLDDEGRADGRLTAIAQSYLAESTQTI